MCVCHTTKSIKYNKISVVRLLVARRNINCCCHSLIVIIVVVFVVLSLLLLFDLEFEFGFGISLFASPQTHIGTQMYIQTKTKAI